MTFRKGIREIKGFAGITTTPILTDKGWFVGIASMIILTDLTIIFNIPFLRQIFGFIFLTILPGLMILHIFRLNKISFLERFILSWGFSIFFIMFFGLVINYISLRFGYQKPLATNPLLIIFNIAFIILEIILLKSDKNMISVSYL